MKEVIATSEKNTKGYMCFADFEFTCGGFIDSTRSEMLSAGAVICSPDYEIAERFYSTAKPNRFPRMTRQCRELTRLTQEEINASPDSDDVLGELAGLMERYGVKKLYVWGNFDKPGLTGDASQHSRAGKSGANIKKVCAMVCDIQAETTRRMQLPQAVSISELSAVFGYTPENGSFHNAMNDAEALYTIHRGAYTTDLDANEDFRRLKQERLDRIAAAREEAEKRKLELAMSLPLSPEEEEYFRGLPEDGVRRFVNLRLVFVKALRRYPDAERLVLLEFRENGRKKVVPEEKFRGPLRGLSSWSVGFRRDEWQRVMLDKCEKPSG